MTPWSCSNMAFTRANCLAIIKYGSMAKTALRVTDALGFTYHCFFGEVAVLNSEAEAERQTPIATCRSGLLIISS